MKKITLFILFISFTIFGFPQSLMRFAQTSQTIPYTAKQQIMQYRLTEFLIESYELGLWEKTDSVYYVYDNTLPYGHGNFDFIEFSNFNTEPLNYLCEWLEMDMGVWNGYYIYYNNFNSDDLRTSTNVDYFNGVEYEGDSRAEYTYTVDDMLESILFLDYTGGGYDEYYRHTYTYSGGQLANLLYEYYGGVWENDLLMVYTFTGSGLIDNIVYKSWDGANWDDSYRYIHSYDVDGNLTERLAQNYSAGWVTSGRYLYMYDGAGFNNEVKLQGFDGTDYIDYQKYDLTEFADGLPESSIASYWDGFVWQFLNRATFKFESYDDGIVSIQDQTSDFQFNIYPNPANENLQTEFYATGDQLVSMIITNTAGQIVNRQTFQAMTGKNSITKYVGNIPSGTYQMSLTIGGAQIAKTFIIK